MGPVLFFRSDVCSDDELSFVEMFAVQCFFEMTTVDIGSIGGGAPGLWEGFLRAQTWWTGVGRWFGMGCTLYRNYLHRGSPASSGGSPSSNRSIKDSV